MKHALAALFATLVCLAPDSADAKDNWYINQPIREVRVEKDAMRIYFVDFDKSKCWKHAPWGKTPFVEISRKNPDYDHFYDVAMAALMSGKNFAVHDADDNRCRMGSKWNPNAVRIYN